MLAKPKSCTQSGCPLASRGFGFATAAGPVGSRILLVGEALGQVEALQGKAFVGPAGWQLDKILKYASIPRETICIHNCVNCKPPGDWMDGAPWEEGALNCCQPNLEATLNEQGIKVVVPMGGTATRRLLGFSKKQWKSFKKPTENFHGTIHEDPYKRFWILPTFHPAILLHGNMKMFGVIVHDLLLAKGIADNGHTPVSPNLKVDPPIEWFLEYVRIIINKSAESMAAGEKLPWLAVDIETPEKEKGVDEAELKVDDPSYIITRVNFATDFDPDFGLTVPWSGPYISGIFKLLACKTLRISVWHQNYDIPRLRKNGAIVAEPIFDMMDGWHFLQSNVPKGLGFVAPFFSRYKTAWKHLSGSQPGIYGAWDGVQTIQNTIGIEKDLIASGQWDVFERHGPMVDRYALKPAEDVGLLFDENELENFQGELAEEVAKTETVILAVIPEELVPLVPKVGKGYKKQPMLDDDTPKPEYFEVTEKLDCYKCLACNKVEVTPKHRCKQRKLYEAEFNKKPFDFNEWEVTKWYTKGQFNPHSSQQILGYIKHQGHKPGRQKKTSNESADAAAIEKLAKRHKKDQVYQNLLKLRKLAKVKSTYVDSALEHLGKDGRVHTVFTNKPSTWRMASEVFNTQNVISSGKREDYGLGKKFRKCVVASPGCYLFESDFCGIEAVQLGWFANSPSYIRLSKMSTHAFMVTHSRGFDDKPAQLDWPDDELREYLSYIKHNKKYKIPYNKNKRVVHSSGYCITEKGLHLTYPEDFPTVKDAKETLDLFFGLFPEIKTLQNSLHKRTHTQMYVGGNEHPFRYKHWFFDVYTFKKVTKQQAKQRQAKGEHCVEVAGTWFAIYPGKDFKRCIAYLPQSTAGGNIREAMLRLFVPGSPWYIGDVYYGKTPLRMPIHDSLMLEIPKAKLDNTVEKVYKAMIHPIIQQPCPDEWGQGELLDKQQLDYLEATNQLNAPREVMERTQYLSIGVEGEMGKNWHDMSSIDLERFD